MVVRVDAVRHLNLDAGRVLVRFGHADQDSEAVASEPKVIDTQGGEPGQAGHQREAEDQQGAVPLPASVSGSVASTTARSSLRVTGGALRFRLPAPVLGSAAALAPE